MMFNKMSAGQKVNGLGVRNDNTRNFSINFFVSQVNCSIINFVCLSSVSQTITLFGNLILSIAFQDKLFFFCYNENPVCNLLGSLVCQLCTKYKYKKYINKCKIEG